MKTQPQQHVVLIVEDSATQAKAATQVLQQAGYVVESTPSINGALASLESSHFDIILIDYFLEDGAGIDLLPLVGGAPSVFVSGYVMKPSRSRRCSWEHTTL